MHMQDIVRHILLIEIKYVSLHLLSTYRKHKDGS